MSPLAVLIVTRKWCAVLMVIGGGALKLFLPALPAVGVSAEPKFSEPQDAVTLEVGLGVAGLGVGRVPGLPPALRPTSTVNASIAAATTASVTISCGTRRGVC